MKNLKFYLESFKSEECLCGKMKKPRHSFCYGCFKALPDHMQKALYSPMRAGYEEAYEDAVRWLQIYHW